MPYSTGRRTEVGMVCALVCHQLLEGLGLGACITAVRQHLSRRKIIAIVAVFSLAFSSDGKRIASG